MQGNNLEEHEAPITSVTYLNGEVEAAVVRVFPPPLQTIVLQYMIPVWQNEELLYEEWNMKTPTLNSLLNQKLVYAIDYRLIYDIKGARIAWITVQLKQTVTFPGRDPKRMAYSCKTPRLPWTLPFRGNSPRAHAVDSDQFYELSNGSIFYCLHSKYHEYGAYFRFVAL